MSIPINFDRRMSNKENEKVEKIEGGDTIESHPNSVDRVPPTPSVEDAKSLAIRLKEIKDKELQQRIADLNQELKPLLERFHFALGAEPYIEDGQVKVRPIIVDMQKDTDI